MSMPADLRYPTGRFAPPSEFTAEWRRQAIDAVAATPARLRAAVLGLNESQLDTPYRQDGWTVRQVVHHVADSHLNAYIRIKLALTEDVPTIKPCEETRWAELPDSADVPIEVSLVLLDALHERWVALLQSMGDADFKRQYVHPETGLHTVDFLLALYAWHGPHHTAYITQLRRRMGW